jgi:hypothetical protein
MEIATLESALGTTDESLVPITSAESRALAGKQARQAALVAEAEEVLMRPKVRQAVPNQSTMPAIAATTQMASEAKDIDSLASRPNPELWSKKNTLMSADEASVQALLAKHRRKPRGEFQSLSDYHLKHGFG